MNKQTTITFSPLAPIKSGTAVVLAEEGAVLSPAGKALDKSLGGVIAKVAKHQGFKGKKKSFLDILAAGSSNLDRVLVVGAGKLKDYSSNDWVDLGAIIRARLSGKDNPVTVVLDTTA